ncbi:Rrf2 family transcriptional regulator [Campylobacter upsaliensis]|nr:Rrf2 family transcriptional regulator [Campylobacter upsaliensis]
MLLTKASEYALLSLIYISSKSTPCDVDTMATELEIPKSFLAKILQNLARDGLLHSYKGAKGGFSLVREPKAYTLASAEKKEVSVFECSGGVCPSQKENCHLLSVLVNLQQKIDNFLDSITLEDIIKNNG